MITYDMTVLMKFAIQTNKNQSEMHWIKYPTYGGYRKSKAIL